MDPLPPIVPRTSQPPPVDPAARIIPARDQGRHGGQAPGQRRRPPRPTPDDEAVTLSPGIHGPVDIRDGDEPGDGRGDGRVHVDVIA